MLGLPDGSRSSGDIELINMRRPRLCLKTQTSARATPDLKFVARFAQKPSRPGGGATNLMKSNEERLFKLFPISTDLDPHARIDHGRGSQMDGFSARVQVFSHVFVRTGAPDADQAHRQLSILNQR